MNARPVHIRKIQTRFQSHRTNPLQPLVVFDMAFTDESARKRTSPAVSGAAMALAGVLREQNIAEVAFMRKPFIRGGEWKVSPQSRALGRPLFFALSVYDLTIKEVKAELKEIKRRLPNAKILLGGPSINARKNFAVLADEFPEADALVRGDGEKVIGKLIAAMAEKGGVDFKGLEGINGLYVRNGSEPPYYREGVNVLTTDEFNALPMVDGYEELVRDIKARGFLPLHTSRSCKYRCIFCSHKYHPQPIFWTAERIIVELKRIKKMVQRGELPKEALHINFTDDDFFQDPERAISFLKQVIADPDLRNSFRFTFLGAVRSFFIKGASARKESQKRLENSQTWIEFLKNRKALIEAGALPEGRRKITLPGASAFPSSPLAIELFKRLAQYPDLKRFFVFRFADATYRQEVAVLQAREGRGRLNNKLLDLLARVKIAGIQIGTDGFSSDAIDYLRKGNYLWEMAWQLMQGLDRRGIQQLHYVILTYPRLSWEQFETILYNCRNALNAFKTLSLSINRRLSACEGTDLMPEGSSLVPMRVPFEDRATGKRIGTLFSLPWKSLYHYMQEEDPSMKNNLKWIRRIERKELKRANRLKPSLGKALEHFSDRTMQFWTIAQLIDALDDLEPIKSPATNPA